MGKIQFLTSVAAVGFTVCATPAWSQAAAGEPQPQAAADDSADSGQILVTARRREERLTDVPIAVTVLSGDSLASKGVERVDDLQNATPGLKLSPTAGRRSNSQYELRGINTIESLITEDPAVGIYVDDVYRARATGTNQSFYDISNVQVLYGPQGTLFGRNSTGGAILISSNHPTDRLEGSFEGGYGNFNQYKLTAMLNVPLGDTLQIRIAGERVKADGYVLNGTTGNKLGGKDSYAGRVSVHFKPNSSLENLLVVSGYTANDGGTPNVIYGVRLSKTPNQFGQVPPLALTPLGGLVAAALAAERATGYTTTYLDGPNATIPVAGGTPIGLTGLTGYLLQGTTPTNTDPYEKPRNFAISNTTSLDLGGNLSLKNIFGYNYTKLETNTDLDGTPIKLIDTYYLTTNHQVSDEIQLSQQSSRFNWVIGALYFRESGLDFQPALQFVQAFGVSTLRGQNTSLGAFAQGTYKITDTLSLTAGGRITHDKRAAQFSNLLAAKSVLLPNGGLGIDQTAAGGCGLKAGVANDGVCGISVKKSFTQPSYTVSIDYKPDRDTLLYIAHRHGYRSGGFNSRITLTASASAQIKQEAAFEPEKVNDIELGFKGNYRIGAQARVRASVALYQSWYTNIQKQTSQVFTDPVSGLSSGITLIQNSGKAKVKGFELNLGVSPIRGFDIDGYLSYVDGHYENFPAPDGTIVASVPFAGAKTTAGVTITQVPAEGRNGKLSFTESVSYRSSYYGDNSLPSFNPEAHMPAQYNVNLAVNWDNILGSPVSASLWARNALNDRHYLGVIDLIPSFGIAVATVGEPRTYGFTLKYKFGK